LKCPFHGVGEDGEGGRPENEEGAVYDGVVEGWRGGGEVDNDVGNEGENRQERDNYELLHGLRKFCEDRSNRV
jgi:hypothetical protein